MQGVPFLLTPKVPFRGILLEFGDVPLIVPAFNLIELRENAVVLSSMDEQLASVQVGHGNETVAFLDLLVQVALPPLQRNYPEITAEWLGERIDMNLMMDLYMALSGATGINSPGKLTRNVLHPQVSEAHV